MSQEGALPRPISGGSREKEELISRREGPRGGLIRAFAAAAPSAPLGEPPHNPSSGHLKGSSCSLAARERAGEGGNPAMTGRGAERMERGTDRGAEEETK